MLALLPYALATPALAEEPPPPPIVNGETTSDYEEVVLLYIESRTAAGGCTGSLIADEWVLTAAHCVADSPRQVWAYVGASTGSGGIDQEAEADAWYPHPDYDGRSGYDDIALVHLGDTFRGVSLMPVDLDGFRRGDVGDDLRLVGWGATSDDDSNQTLRKRTVTVPLDAYDDKLIVTYDEADAQNGCYGDSGGPVLRERDDGGYAVVGVMDFLYGGGCDSGGLASARVDHFIDWIEGYTPVYTYEDLPDPDDEDPPADDDAPAFDGEGPDAPALPDEVGEDYDVAACGTARGGASALGALLALAAVGRRRRYNA